MKANVVSETPVCQAEVKEVLDEVKKRDGELSFRAQKTFDYLEQFAPLSRKKADDLFKKLQSLEVPRMKDAYIWKLVDILPKDGKDIKTILQGYAITVSSENLKKLADVIAEFI
ncbi:MAG: hypothetical protein HY363_02310 [Candidatus Aenigmarchaeota archaeon]|nr:hypothetical protein [Candidatus Aenigmarchaeota archaeon]